MNSSNNTRITDIKPFSKTLIFGNSGAGKSTLAKALAKANNLAHLDLDTLAWLPSDPPERKPLQDSAQLIAEFVSRHKRWVIEGCYTDLLECAAPASYEIIYLDLTIEDCIENAKKRPWEPHKYPTKKAQDANLDMLLHWIRDYDVRTDTFSKTAHEHFYENYVNKKRRITARPKITNG